jgi:hypothetical protein
MGAVNGLLVRSPVNPITNVLPLVLVLSVSLAKEAFEDRKRAAKDKEVPHPCFMYREAETLLVSSHV